VNGALIGQGHDEKALAQIRGSGDPVARHPAETTDRDEHHADAVIERELQRL
jgi:hypothetical protein